MSGTVTAQQIRDAGGFAKWKRREEVQPSVLARSSINGQFDKFRNLSSFPSAKGRKPQNKLVGYDADRMNKLEAKYAAHLEIQRRAGKILFWRFESVKFRLADRTWYTPDFYIMRPDGSIEIHETKGHWEDDARVKIKATAEQFPEFWFVAVQLKKGEWKSERFRATKTSGVINA